jgi:hypothetical protein
VRCPVFKDLPKIKARSDFSGRAFCFSIYRSATYGNWISSAEKVPNQLMELRQLLYPGPRRSFH